MDYLKEALALVQAQASVRVMSEEEMVSMISALQNKLAMLENGGSEEAVEEVATAVIDPKKSIKEKSIICCECGKVFKVITKKHLTIHGLCAATYREKYGLKKGTPLTCKELQRARRQKMKDMRLWEKRAMARAMTGGNEEL